MDSDTEFKFTKKYKCSKCVFRADTKTGLLNHLRKHNKIIRYTCPICQETFDTNKELIKHKEGHSTQSYICTKCQVAFTDTTDWLIHNLKHKKQENNYKCIECQQYYQKSTIAAHIYTHSSKVFTCSKCEKTFNTENRLKIHKQLHTNSFKCVECGKKYTNKISLDYHMVSHTGLKLCQCLYCGRAFANSNQVTIHTRTHTNERPYICDKCGKSFKQYTDHSRHKCVKEKMYQCDICKKMFKDKSYIVLHLRLHSGDLPFPCQHCPRKFSTSKSLEVHTIYKHTDEKPFACNYEDCATRFKTARDKKRHLIKVHKHPDVYQ